jgi:SAM-dependent methyltransferase
MPSIEEASRAGLAKTVKRVLNAGSGPPSARQPHPVFRKESWQEVRLDIDAQSKPDLIGSIVNMGELIPSASFDAIWSSHSLEHLYAHEVPLALAEFRRVLKRDGFALVTSPDLELVASLVLEHGLDHVAYTAAAGPITARDIFFGHSESIARGKHFMAHHTGFTSASLGQLLVNAGFPVVLVNRERFAIWALALMEEADKPAVQRSLKAAGLGLFDEIDEVAP